jgi:hypothetical protein
MLAAAGLPYEMCFATRLVLEGRVMSANMRLLGAGVAAAVTLAVAACSSPPLSNNDGVALDEAYGIPPGSVPPGLLRPDGLLINGLLPEPPNSGS